MFSIRTGINGLLDVARKTYSETIEDIYSLCETTREKYGWKNLTIKYSAKRGFFFQTNNFSGEFPQYCIQIKKQKNNSTFSTENLLKLNERQKESMKEIMILSSRVVSELLLDLRSHIATIYNINDSVALLDLLLSLTTFATLSNEIAKPEITRDGPIAIKSGRNPLVELFLNSQNHFIPNDTFCSKESNFHVITGPNMSGKSTYIRQIALNLILAHLGSFVCAKFASIRLTDRLFSRINTNDSIEENASSFMMEMKEMAFILQNLTPSSVVIIDELGRGTSIEDGLSLAWSISEELLLFHNSSFIFFVTHFNELENLQFVYSNVKIFHLIVEQSNLNQVKFAYQMAPGLTKIERYGIDTAISAGFPDSLINESQQLVDQLSTNSFVNYNNHPSVVLFIERLKRLYLTANLDDNNNNADDNLQLQQLKNDVENFILNLNF